MGKLRQLLSPEPHTTGGWQSTGVVVAPILFVAVADHSFKGLAEKIQIDAKPICYGVTVGGHSRRL